MAMRALSIAATGGRAMMNTIDTIANNLANVNTTGFKRMRANFADLFYQQIQRAGFGTPAQNQSPTGLSFGTGVRLVSTEKLFEQGSLERTDRDLDLAIDGEGFFKVKLPNNTVAYTRAGNLNIDSAGTLVTADGYPLEPSVSIDSNISQILVDATGKVQGFNPATPEQLQDITTLELTRFINPSGLEAIGDNLFRATAAAGEANEGTPATAGFGTIRQGFLEESNVDVVKELVDLIQTQRAFEINGNSIQSADEILQTVNNLRR